MNAIQIETQDRHYYFLSGDNSFKSHLLSCEFPVRKSVEEVIEEFNEANNVKVTVDMLPIAQQRFYIGWERFPKNPESLKLRISVNDVTYHISGETKGCPSELLIQRGDEEQRFEIDDCDWELVVRREMPFISVDFIKQLIMI